jgi:hypothetical protein
MVTKREHLIALRRHDWSYMMSDDGSVYRRGAAAESGLITAEKTSPELAGMFKEYHDWWWNQRNQKVPAPTFGVAME